MATHTPEQKGQRAQGLTIWSELDREGLRSPGNHSSIRASMLSTTEHSSLDIQRIRAVKNEITTVKNEGLRVYCALQSSAGFFLTHPIQ